MNERDIEKFIDFHHFRYLSTPEEHKFIYNLTHHTYPGYHVFWINPKYIGCIYLDNEDDELYVDVIDIREKKIIHLDNLSDLLQYHPEPVLDDYVATIIKRNPIKRYTIKDLPPAKYRVHAIMLTKIQPDQELLFFKGNPKNIGATEDGQLYLQEPGYAEYYSFVSKKRPVLVYYARYIHKELFEIYVKKEERK